MYKVYLLGLAGSVDEIKSFLSAPIAIMTRHGEGGRERNRQREILRENQRERERE